MRRPLGNFLTQHAVPTAAHIIPVWSVTAAKAMCAKTAGRISHVRPRPAVTLRHIARGALGRPLELRRRRILVDLAIWPSSDKLFEKMPFIMRTWITCRFLSFLSLLVARHVADLSSCPASHGLSAVVFIDLSFSSAAGRRARRSCLQLTMKATTVL